MTDSLKNLYLESSEFINWQCESVQKMALQLRSNLKTDTEIAKACFEFVRDEVRHTFDYQLDDITCSASDVLRFKTGYCYSKSHLLAALLRANRIPAGLCYQRLSLYGKGGPFCLHGLNAIYLEEFGWYRVDPRGNKEGVHAVFSPPNVALAFPLTLYGEVDIQGIWPEPLPVVIDVLTRYSTCKGVYENLPDIALYD